jgi:hypothetical protein
MNGGDGGNGGKGGDDGDDGGTGGRVGGGRQTVTGGYQVSITTFVIEGKTEREKRGRGRWREGKGGEGGEGGNLGYLLHPFTHQLAWLTNPPSQHIVTHIY